MTSPVQTWSVDIEKQALSHLRGQYTAKGYTFTIDPEVASLPEFLDGYRPDAIAQKPGENVAIEVKNRPHPAAELSLQEIRRRFDGRDDWKFVVSYFGVDATQRVSIPTASKPAITESLNDVRQLVEHGQERAAFVMAWSLLEAALHSVENDESKRPRTPGTVVQSLAMLGLIDPPLEQRIRPLIDLRNRIVHGDLSAVPTREDVLSVVTSVEQALLTEH
jgi:REase_AHJR-like